MKNPEKRISVCMATYNGERYVQEQLRSIIPQLGINDEIIVSDDRSSDRTLQMIQALNDKRITVITNTGKPGPTWNFENALRHASGRYIFLSDQDDIWYPNKVAVYLGGLEKYDLVTSDCNIIDAKGKVVLPSYYEINRCKRGVIYNFYRNSYLGCCLAFQRNVLEKCLPFPEKTPMHDIWIGMIAECFFRPLMMKEILMGYRRHGENFSTASSKSKNSLLQKLMFRFNVLTAIVWRYFRK